MNLEDNKPQLCSLSRGLDKHSSDVIMVFFAVDPMEGDYLLRLVLAVQLEDVPGSQVPLAQACAQRHLQPPARAW